MLRPLQRRVVGLGGRDEPVVPRAVHARVLLHCRVVPPDAERVRHELLLPARLAVPKAAYRSLRDSFDDQRGPRRPLLLHVPEAERPGVLVREHRQAPSLPANR